MIDNYDRSLTALNTTANNCPRDEFSFRTTSSSAVGSDQKSEAARKIICRYGRGCTHMHDACHRFKFWHPPMPALTGQAHNSVLHVFNFFQIACRLENIIFTVFLNKILLLFTNSGAITNALRLQWVWSCDYLPWKTPGTPNIHKYQFTALAIQEHIMSQSYLPLSFYSFICREKLHGLINHWSAVASAVW